LQRQIRAGPCKVTVLLSHSRFFLTQHSLMYSETTALCCWGWAGFCGSGADFPNVRM